ncbi:unnamed protein product [Nezara viridula]|uniref:Uncharacterized protein n=1 Tax=Nezara viridula TaxID=85310 RepID=A0A9P0GXH1_NEZVI|nr:unnamed protein product [Nezara viridula]
MTLDGIRNSCTWEVSENLENSVGEGRIRNRNREMIDSVKVRLASTEFRTMAEIIRLEEITL